MNNKEEKKSHAEVTLEKAKEIASLVRKRERINKKLEEVINR